MVGIDNLIAECTGYDLKAEVEKKKIRSWMKSVSAFANSGDGSLFFGVDDDHNLCPLEDIQSDAEFVSECITSRMDPIPEIELIPHKLEGGNILQLVVHKGKDTPYYYTADGSRSAYIRVGNESVAAPVEKLKSLVLAGRNMTFDSVSTDIPRDKHSFAILANTFAERTGVQFESQMLISFGLIDERGCLTNAGLLLADNCPLMQSRLYCTLWDGLYKDDAINDAEYKGNILLLLREGQSFIKSSTRKGWIKLPDTRRNLPEYADRAVLEALVNHIIHRDYTVLGGEVHIDIFDDRIEFSSPGGMYDGTLIQNRNLSNVPSRRRNPVIADVFAQMNLMEKRGSGLRRICTLSAALDGYREEFKPEFVSTGEDFITIIKNVRYSEQINEQINGPVNKSNCLTDKQIDKLGEPVNEQINEPVNEPVNEQIKLTANEMEILKLLSADSSLSFPRLAEQSGLSVSTVKRAIRGLRFKELLTREGSDKTGRWVVTHTK